LLSVLFALCFSSQVASWGPMLLNDCDRGVVHDGVHWSSFGDGTSTVSPQPLEFGSPGYRPQHAAHLTFTFRPGPLHSFAGMVASISPTNLSDFEGVRFRARGSGSWLCFMSTAGASATHDDFGSPFAIDPEWQSVELPFHSMAQREKHGSHWSRTGALGIVWLAAGFPGQSGWIDVDDVEFYRPGGALSHAPPANVVLAEPKVNQVGYLPNARKIFSIAQTADLAQGGAPFQVVDGNRAVHLSGHLSLQAIDDTAHTGEKVYQGDFSKLTRPGRYWIVVGGRRSAPFHIAPDVYEPLYRSAIRCFRLIRCGTAVDDRVTGIRHPACHASDAVFRGDETKLDLTGGWHNACDYGKFTIEAAISCAWMLNLAELEGVRDATLLDEARWGLEWILKMQKPDGGVLTKVDSEDHFSSGTSPDKDPFPRYYKLAGCISTGDAVGVLCLASRVYHVSDPRFAARCLNAAKHGWEWLEAHPDSIIVDADYVDHNALQEKLWALGEMARTTGNRDLQSRWRRDSASVGLRAPSWMEPQFFGFLAQRKQPAVVLAIRAVCDPMIAASDENGYGVLLNPMEYTWESNETLLMRTSMLLCCARITGEKKYQRCAERQLDWLLGTNGIGLSFVTGFGGQSVTHPWHWTAMALGKLMPGWVAGGPNRWESGDPMGTAKIRLGTPPAKCFVDANGGTGSYSTNEGETCENAALVFAAGCLSRP